MAEVKGAQLKAVILFLEGRFGEEAVKSAIQGLSPEDHALLPPVLLDSNWYPYTVWRAVRRISRVLATAAREDFTLDMGKFIAQYVFTGVYKSLLTKDPAKLLGKFGWLHEFFYRDTNTIETKMLGPTSGAVEYRYFPDAKPARSTCVSTMGFWIRALELAGANNVRAEHTKCMTDGDETCEYLMEWS